jgi:hypothetical protein
MGNRARRTKKRSEHLTVKQYSELFEKINRGWSLTPGELIVVKVTAKGSRGVPLRGRVVKKLQNPSNEQVAKVVRDNSLREYVLLTSPNIDAPL